MSHVISGPAPLRRAAGRKRLTRSGVYRAAFLLGLVVCALAAARSPAPLQPQPGTYRISGRVVDSGGAPAASGLELTVGTEGSTGSFSVSPVPLALDGSFSTRRLAPGTYVLEVRQPRRLKPEALAPEGELRIVRVTGSDVKDVVVTTHPSYAMTGRFRMESDNPAAAWPPQIVVGAWVASDGAGFLGASTAEGASGGRFVLRDVYGPRVLRCGYRLDGRSRWWPGQVLLDGVDITDVPTDFSAVQGRRLEVVFTQHPARFAGRVTGSHGQPVPQAWVVLFRADRAGQQRWSAKAHAVQADFKGVFDFASLPGRYLATAVPPQMWLTRERLLKDLERLSKDAIRVELKDRERTTVQLQIAER